MSIYWLITAHVVADQNIWTTNQAWSCIAASLVPIHPVRNLWWGDTLENIRVIDHINVNFVIINSLRVLTCRLIWNWSIVSFKVHPWVLDVFLLYDQEDTTIYLDMSLNELLYFFFFFFVIVFSVVKEINTSCFLTTQTLNHNYECILSLSSKNSHRRADGSENITNYRRRWWVKQNDPKDCNCAKKFHW